MDTEFDAIKNAIEAGVKEAFEMLNSESIYEAFFGPDSEEFLAKAA